MRAPCSSSLTTDARASATLFFRACADHKSPTSQRTAHGKTETHGSVASACARLILSPILCTRYELKTRTPRPTRKTQPSSCARQRARQSVLLRPGGDQPCQAATRACCARPTAMALARPVPRAMALARAVPRAMARARPVPRTCASEATAKRSWYGTITWKNAKRATCAAPAGRAVVWRGAILRCKLWL